MRYSSSDTVPCGKKNPPFGNVMPGREYANGAYRFGFNGQERDYELNSKGNINTAEFWEYDTRLGRRFNTDPKGLIPNSPYSCFSNNPIVKIDPFGDKDFYNLSGEWIGTDGDITNTAKVLITDTRVAKLIRKTSRKGQDYKAELPNGSFQILPAKNVLDAIVCTFEVSQLKTALDPDGDKHEVGTRIDHNGIEETVIATSSPMEKEVWDCSSDGAGINADRFSIQTGSVNIHTHPTGMLKCEIGNNTFHKVVNGAEQSPDDMINALNFDLNIIIRKDGNEQALTRKTVVDQNKPRTSAGTPTTEILEDNREIRVFFFTGASKTAAWSINFQTLKSINDDTTKKDSKTYKKYEKNHNKAANEKKE